MNFAKVYGEVSKEILIAKITNVKEITLVKAERVYTNAITESGCGFKIVDNKSNWSLVNRYGFDAIEMVQKH